MDGWVGNVHLSWDVYMGGWVRCAVLGGLGGDGMVLTV